MVWFQCDDCGDSLKKGHTSCVSEHDKYALSATKPGGKAAGGHDQQHASKAASQPVAPPDGDKFLAKKAPWDCACCKVKCTSPETLAGHATGKKHRNKVKATLLREAEAAGGAGAAAPDATAKGKLEANEPVSTGETASHDKKRKAEGDKQAETQGKKPKSDVKWKKYITNELQSREGGRLKVKELQKAAVQRVLKDCKTAEGLDEEALREEMLAVLNSSSQFIVEGKVAILKKSS